VPVQKTTRPSQSVQLAVQRADISSKFPASTLRDILCFGCLSDVMPCLAERISFFVQSPKWLQQRQEIRNIPSQNGEYFANAAEFVFELLHPT
jgi:hypothetical protein